MQSYQQFHQFSAQLRLMLSQLKNTVHIYLCCPFSSIVTYDHNRTLGQEGEKQASRRNIPQRGKRRHEICYLWHLNMGVLPQEHFLTTETVRHSLTLMICLFTLFHRRLIGKSMYTYAYSLSFRLRLYIYII